MHLRHRTTHGWEAWDAESPAEMRKGPVVIGDQSLCLRFPTTRPTRHQEGKGKEKQEQEHEFVVVSGVVSVRAQFSVANQSTSSHTGAFNTTTRGPLWCARVVCVGECSPQATIFFVGNRDFEGPARALSYAFRGLVEIRVSSFSSFLHPVVPYRWPSEP